VRRPVVRDRPRLVHLTTTDMSLDWLLGPQLQAFGAAGCEVIGMSAAGPHVAALHDAGIRHVAVEHATRAISPTDDLAALFELRRLFQRLQPDIVHTHNPKPGVYGRIAARSTGTPVVVNTQHGLYATPEDPLPRRTFVYSLERIAAACSDAELVQNGEDVETLARLGVARSKLTVLGNGIDLARFRPDESGSLRQAVREELGFDDGEVVVGLVGRLVAEKGYREVFAAAALLKDRVPSVRFVVVGPEEHAKADAISEQELQDARASGVRLLGQRTDVERLYAGMDLYVLASYREGFPRSAMEAAACGLPVIATDIRGCRQAVDHERTGLLVPVRDAHALADAVERLARDPALRQKFGAAAIDKAREQFDQQRIIDTTLATYERLLGRNPVSDRPKP
jgi:glycosyltransferase involved in cell wall biosynthesis